MAEHLLGLQRQPRYLYGSRPGGRHCCSGLVLPARPLETAPSGLLKRDSRHPLLDHIGDWLRAGRSHWPLLLDKHMEAITKPSVVAVSLIVGGIILWLVDRGPVRKHNDPVDLADITTKQAALVGLGQSLAIVPGVSRLGATIVSAA